MPDSTPTPAPPKGELPSTALSKLVKMQVGVIPRDTFTLEEAFEIGDKMYDQARNVAMFEAESELTRSRAALLESERQLENVTKQAVIYMAMAEKAKARAEAAEQSLAQQRWIPVGEKPKKEREVLVSDIDGAIYIDDSWWLYGFGAATHWRELPPAPSEAK